ncbi:MAG: class I adenylate-forming enzyme family protein [Chloroflexota bacterium]
MESIYQVFESRAKKVPDKISLVYLGNEYTYSQLLDMIQQVAHALSNLGLVRGQTAIIFLPNCPQWIVVWFALQLLDVVPVPITPYYGPSDLEFIANDSGAETIFCLDTNFGYVSRIRSHTNLKHVIVTSLVELLPQWKQILGRILNRVPQGNVRLNDNTLTFGQLLRPVGGASESLKPSGNVKLANLLYTGGTTGRPKGVPISRAYMLETMREDRRNSEAVIPLGEDVKIQGAPLYHVLGQCLGVGALLHGDKLVLLPRINLDAVMDHIQRYRATMFFGVPALFRMILEHDRVDQYDLSSLKYCFTGGDALPGEVARRWNRKFGKPIYQGYGATETCGTISLTPLGQPFPEGTVGKIVSHQRVKIVNPDSLDSVAAGESGEVMVASEHMTDGYWNAAQESSRFFVHGEDGIWYRTSDIALLDADGWLFFQERTADIIKHKGYRIAASRIESVLQENTAVIASCVIGIPDIQVGERIKAFVVLNENVKGITAYDLIAWCRERLAPYEVPSYIEFRDMLPRSKVGKLLRRELREEEKRKVQVV